MAQGQHIARVSVQGDTRNAQKELDSLAKRNRALEGEIESLTRKLLSNAKAHDAAGDAAARGAAKQGKAVTTAQKNAAALRAAAESGANLTADNARRAREALEAEGPASKRNLSQRLAAIEREKAARLQLVAVELRSAKSVADAYAAQNRAQQIQHDAHMRRMKAQQQAKGGGSPLGGLMGGGGLGAAGGLAAYAGGALAAAAATDTLTKEALMFQNVAANVPFSIEKARQATKGLVSDYDLMVQAQQAMRLGVAKNSEDFAQLAEVATKLGLSVGRGPTESLNDLTSGLGRASTELLDNLGITLRAEESHKIYAARLGKTKEELTDLEKRQAVITIGLERGAEAADRVSVSADGAAGAFQRLKTDLVNGFYAVLNLDDALSDLATETLKSFGLNAYQAARATDALAEAAGIAARVGVGVLTLGASEAGIAIYDYATATDTATSAAKRGVAGISELSKFLHENQTWAERAAAAMSMFGETLYQAEQRRALALRDLQDLENKYRQDLQDKAEEFEEKQEKERERKDKARAKKAAEARKAAFDLRIAEAEHSVAFAKRELAETQRLYDRQKATYSDLLALVQSLHTAEQELATIQFQAATNRAEELRAITSLQDQDLSQRHALLDLAEHETRVARERARAEQEAAQAAATAAQERRMSRELATGGLADARALGAAGLSDAGILAGIRGQSSQEDLAAKLAADRLAHEVDQNDQRRALRAAQLAEDRAFYSAQLTDAATAADAKAQLARIEQETAQLAHEARLDALRVEETAEQQASANAIKRAQERAQRFRAAQSESLSFARSMATTALTMRRTEEAAVKAAREAGESEAAARRKARGQSLISLGEQLQGEAIAHGAESVAAFLTGNPIGGAGHAAAAVALGVAGTALKGRGESMAGAGDRGIGIAPTSSADSAGSGAAGGSGSGYQPPDIPPSPIPRVPTPGNPTGAPAPMPTSQGTAQSTTNNVTINAWGSVDKDSARRMIEAIGDIAVAG